MIFSDIQYAFNEGYKLALSRAGNLQSGEYWKDWIDSDSKKKYEKAQQSIRYDLTQYITHTGIENPNLITNDLKLDLSYFNSGGYIGGCIDTKFCNSCNTIYYSSICVCALQECSKCGNNLSLNKTNSGEYIRVKC